MASTYSSNLKIELMGTGENAGTWGTITNTNLGTAYEQAVIGLGNPDYTSDTNLTITLTNSNAAQAARALVLNVTSVFGSLTQTRELIVPTIQKQYIVQNNTTGGQSITVKTSGGTGITVPNGRKAHLYVDGTNVIQMFDFVDINGGTIDGATVGAASASTGAFTSLTASGATTLNGAVALGDASGDLITVPGTVNSNLLFTDATYDIGASGATRPRDLFLSRNLTVGGTLTLAGGVNLNGNVTVGDSSADTLTINSTITSNLIFTDNTYDIGASGATRPRSLFLAGNITAAGNQTLTGALTVDSTTDSSSTTTGSIQTDGGVGIAKALFVGTTANIAGVATFSAGSAAAPAITTTGDTNTGIWFPAADTIAFTEGGVESLRIDASGNLGLGVTPSAWTSFKVFQIGARSSLASEGTVTDLNLNVYYDGSYRYLATAAATQYRQQSGNHYWYNAASGTAGSVITLNQAMNLDTSSNLLLGLTGGGGKSIAINSDLTTTGAFLYNDTGQTILSTCAAVPMIFRTSNTERIRITSAGLVGIGTTSPATQLELYATSPVLRFSGDGSNAANTLIGGTEFFNRDASVAGPNVAAFIKALSFQAVGAGAYLTFATSDGNEGEGASATEKMRLDQVGNLGLGVTPSAWGTAFRRAIQLFTGGSIAGGDGPTFVSVAANTYLDSTPAYKYIGTGQATRFEQQTGEFTWHTAGSGTAGNTATFAQVMTLSNAGNVALSGSAPSAFGATYKAFQPAGYAAYAGDSYYGRAEILNNAYASNIDVFNYYDSNAAGRYSMQLGAHKWFSAGSGTTGGVISWTQAMTLGTDGNLILGGTSPTTSSGYTSLSINNATNSGYLILQSNGVNKSDWYVSGGTIASLRGVGVPLLLSATGANYLAFETNDTERARIDSAGQMIIGSTSVGRGDKLTVVGAGSSATVTSSVRGLLAVESNTATAQNVGGAISLGGNYDGGRTQYAAIGGFKESTTASEYGGYLAFFTRPNGDLTRERARIDSSGTFLVGKTDTGLTVAGVGIEASGVVGIGTNTATPMFINRQGSDGTLIEFRQADVGEGTISVSGTTVSYNGGNLSRWAQTTAPKDESIVKGTVLSNLDEMNVYTDANGNPVANEQLNKVKVSDVEGDANVAGVCVNWSYDEQHSVDEINMAMTGDMIIRIAQGTTVVRGDLLMSAGDGTAKPQGDDIVRSKTVAKVTSNHITCTYADGSYCVPCVLMAC
jgi:hypothetical protein